MSTMADMLEVVCPGAGDALKAIANCAVETNPEDARAFTYAMMYYLCSSLILSGERDTEYVKDIIGGIHEMLNKYITDEVIELESAKLAYPSNGPSAKGVN